MQAPPIDKRSHDDLVAWIEQLTSCGRAVPGAGLAGAVLDGDVVDPVDGVTVVASSGTLVDDDLAARIGELSWLSVGELVAGGVLVGDVENPATRQVHRTGTVVDAVLAGVLDDLARICGSEVLAERAALSREVHDPVEPRTYPAGTTIDTGLAAVIDRQAWVRVRSWRPDADGGPDAGRALVRIAGRFAELVVDRVNRAAEKHELAFLNLTGTEPAPPRPARVPLTFTLAASSPVDAVVPAGTQVAAPPLEGEEDEVVFETERSVVVSRAQLQAVVVSDTETDTYSDRTREVTGEIDRSFPAFRGEQAIIRRLYVACDPLLTRPGAKDVTLSMPGNASAPLLASWPISWAYWDGVAWRPATSSSTAGPGAAWQVTLSQLPPLVPTTVGGREAGWLRAELGMPLPPGRSGLAPESVATGNRPPQDLQLPLAPFGDIDQVKWFYLSADEAIGVAGLATVRFQVRLLRPGAGAGVRLNWTYRVGSEWRRLGESSATASQLGVSEHGFVDGTQAFTRDGDVVFRVPAEWPAERFYARMGRWLRVEIDDGGGSYTTLPRLASLTASYGWEPVPSLGRITVRASSKPEPQAPPAGAFDGSTLDLSKDFYPFGEQPQFNDTLHLAVPEALARPRTALRLRVTLTNPPGTTSPPGVFVDGRPQLAWEAWDGRTWRGVPVDDRTLAFTASGDVTLTLPDGFGPTAVDGEERPWLRVRLVAGHYGRASTYRTEVKDGVTVYVPVPATYAPPVIRSVTIEPVAASQEDAPPSACLVDDAFGTVDRTAAAATEAGGPFAPFAPSADREPALYLGFDQPFDNQPTTLYLQVEPPAPEEVAADQLLEIDPTTAAEVAWEYAGPNGWRPLGAVDETGSLARRGLVTFAGPPDLTPRASFGRTLCWLRARWLRGYFRLEPRLRRVSANTTWASQVASIQDEILGSGSGRAGQAARTAQAPVQPGQRIMVREPEPPAPAEQAALTALEGDDAVEVTWDAAGQPDEVWVRWHHVPDLYDAGPRDRYYTLDRLTGEVRFGDGRYGMAPPPGQNNIRVTYRTGGGDQGNRAAETIVELRSGIPYVDAVTNHEPAQGGAAGEPIDRLRDRGPRLLRHRDRAVTLRTWRTWPSRRRPASPGRWRSARGSTPPTCGSTAGRPPTPI